MVVVLYIQTKVVGQSDGTADEGKRLTIMDNDVHILMQCNWEKSTSDDHWELTELTTAGSASVTTA